MRQGALWFNTQMIQGTLCFDVQMIQGTLYIANDSEGRYAVMFKRFRGYYIWFDAKNDSGDAML